MQGLGFCGLDFFALTTCGSKYLLEDIYPRIQKSWHGSPGDYPRLQLRSALIALLRIRAAECT